MARDPKMLILLHHYRQARPAVDESQFRNHGLCRDTVFLSDGARPGSGALSFGANSAVKVAASPSWERLRALVVDVLVRFDGAALNTRRNIVEGDGCFAFYVAPGGELRFDFFALVEGQAAPGWHGVSSVAHAIAQPRPLETGHWVRLRAAFDGLATARLWIDGERVAQRSGFRSSIGSPGGAGVTIGNWTLSSQFPLLGALDWIAVWRLDEDAVTNRFVDRLQPAARDEWSLLAACLRARIDAETLKSLLAPFERLLLQASQCMATADPRVREEYARLIALYAELWAGGLSDGDAYRGVLVRLHRLLTLHCRGELADQFLRLAHRFASLVEERRIDCIDGRRLGDADPMFAAAFSRLDAADFA